MKKILSLLLVFAFVIFSSQLVSGAEKSVPTLKFNKDGQFKISQFTDVHYVSSDEKSKASEEMISEVLDKEKPALVVFTGDIVVGGDVFAGWDAVTAPVIKRQIPWAVVLGNHDDEAGKSRKEIWDYLIKKPYSLCKPSPANVKGVCNYVLEVFDENKSDKEKPAALLYLLDSNAYSTNSAVKGYGWFGFDQIQWYRDQSAKFTKENGGKPLPALAFFHIPLNEYTQLDRSKLVGLRSEDECPGAVNSGMFAAFLEAGDVMGTFVGHEHDNDYIGILGGIALAYGRFTGTKTTYTNLPHGSRIIQLKNGARGFDTWIRLANDEVIHVANVPESFTESK
ncbi:MAG: metallophosphoesterase family protein [Thermoguttaceae bacterium]